MPKYEHLTGEDLGYKPSALEQARFDYSPLSKFLNKGLKEDKKKEGPLKILKNIKGKNDEQLKAIEDQGNRQLDAIKNFETDSESLKTIAFFSLEAKKLLDEIKKEKNTIDSEKLVCVKTDGKVFNFSIFKYSLEFASNIYHKDENSLKDTKNKQYEMLILLNRLKQYKPSNLKKK